MRHALKTRYLRIRKTSWAAAIAVVALVLAPAMVDAEPRFGGELVAGIASGPGTLDPHKAGNGAEIAILQHVFEGLVVMDEGYNPILSLASAVEVSKGSTQFSFTLREGVLFHNGKEMTSADVLASFERYREISPNAKALADVESFEAPDNKTFIINLKSANAMFLDVLKTPRHAMAILPAEEATKSPDEMELIGTGPFSIGEWVRDSHLLLQKFDNYVANEASEEPDGFGGKRVAYLDSVRFRFVTEAQGRVAGLQAGDVDAITGIPPELTSRFKGNEDVIFESFFPSGMHLFVVHATNEITANPKIRQAIRAAVNVDDIMEVATGGEFKKNHSMLYPTSAFYPGDATDGFYDQNDIELAKSLMAEAGYNGEKLVLQTNSNYAIMRDAIIVLSEQLREAGFNVSVDVVDWTTNAANLQKGTGNWNVSTSIFGSQPLLGPTQWREIATNFPHYGDDAIVETGYAKLFNSDSVDARREAWMEVERRLLEQAYFIKGADLGTKHAWRSEVKGYKPWYTMRFWDVGIEE